MRSVAFCSFPPSTPSCETILTLAVGFQKFVSRLTAGNMDECYNEQKSFILKRTSDE
jgi:hypothetical protein